MPDTPPIVDAEIRLAALNPLHSFCVTAPAGSGKTELLIQRFLTVLARVAEPEEVLAITFTRKAAAEMRARVLAALDMARDDQPPADPHRRRTRQLARAVLERSDKGQWRLPDLPSRLNIRTIDSWNAYLTRQMPVLSNFGGPTSPLDDAGAHYLRAVRSLLDLTAGGHWIGEHLTRVLLYFDNNWSRLEQLLARMLARREQWLPHLGSQLNSEVAEQSVQQSIQTLVEDHLSTLAKLIEPWQHSLLELEAYSAGNLGRSELAVFPGAAAGDLLHWLRIGELLLTDQGNWRRQVTRNHGFPAGEGRGKAGARARKDALYALLDALRGQPNLQRNLHLLRCLPRAETSADHWRVLTSLARLLPVLAAQLSVVFQQEGVVDHAQIAIAANAALGGEDSATDLAMKLDYRLRHILIDEFQDISVTQFDLLCRLTRNWAGDNRQQPNDPNTLFIVGDGMQSIYGFRDADVSLFVQVKERGVNGLHLQNLELQTNFRSQTGLVNWIGGAFAQAFPDVDDIQSGAVRFSACVAHRAEQEQSVTLLGCRGEGGDEHACEAQQLAEVIAAGMADDDCESIAVLVRTRRHLTELISVLKQRDIPWQAQEIDQLGRSPVVAELMNLCQALHNYADDVAWLALLRSPWCGLSLGQLHRLCENRQDTPLWQHMQEPSVVGALDASGAAALEHFNRIIRRGIARRERLPLRVWIEEIWLNLRGPASVLNPSQLADARDFFDLLEEMDALGQTYQRQSLEQRVAHLFSQPGSKPSKLQLMTLHRSKGLEFDWVIIPGLARRPPNEQREILLWDDFVTARGRRGLLLAADDRGQQQGSVYAYLQEQHKRRRDIEATRLLYVGCTRARNRLFLSAVLRASREGNGVQPPASRSLLACIWPSYSEAAQLVRASQANDPVPASGRTFRRLPPAPAIVEEPVPPEQHNIPGAATNPAARVVGNLIHLSLQRLSALSDTDLARFDPGIWDDWWTGYLSVRLAEASECAAALSRVRQALAGVLNDHRGRWLISAAHEDARSEFPISHLDEQQRLREYVIDRTFVEDNVRWIIDYKSAEPKPGEDLQDFLQHEEARYSLQLGAYKRALRAFDSREIKTALYFTSLAHFHECG